MRIIKLFFVGLILLASWPALAQEDVRIEIRLVEETETLSTGEKWVTEKRVIVELGDEVARLDQGEDFSCIVHRDRGEMLWMDHQDQTVTSLDLPARLENLVKDSRLKTALRWLQQRRPEWLGKSQEKIQGREATVHSWSLRGQDTVKITAWMVDLKEVDKEIYVFLRQNCDFLQLQASWLHQVYAQAGMPYRQKIIREAQTFTKVETSEVVEIVGFKPTPETYQPPKAYSRVPFDASKYLSFDGGGSTRPQ